MSKNCKLAQLSRDLSEIKGFTDIMFMASKGLTDASDSKSIGLGLTHLLYLVERLQERVEDAR